MLFFFNEDKKLKSKVKILYKLFTLSLTGYNSIKNQKFLISLFIDTNTTTSWHLLHVFHYDIHCKLIFF